MNTHRHLLEARAGHLPAPMQPTGATRPRLIGGTRASFLRGRSRPMALLLMIAGFSVTAASVVVAQVGETRPAEQVERHLSSDQKFQLWSQDPKQLDSERG